MTAAGSEAAASVPIKFSDLVGYLQLLQTRIGITLTVIALTGAATGTLAPLLPQLPAGAIPVMVYVAAIALTVSAMWVTQVIGMPAKLRQLIFERLRTRALPSADFVETELHIEFVAELERKQKGLRRATRFLRFGLGLLALHAYFLILLNRLPIVAELTNTTDLKLAEYLGLPATWSLFTLAEAVLTFFLIVYTVWTYSIPESSTKLRTRPSSATTGRPT
jgi:hypothetical protein